MPYGLALSALTMIVALATGWIAAGRVVRIDAGPVFAGVRAEPGAAGLAARVRTSKPCAPAKLSGYKVVFVPFKDGKPAGSRRMW